MNSVQGWTEFVLGGSKSRKLVNWQVLPPNSCKNVKTCNSVKHSVIGAQSSKQCEGFTKYCQEKKKISYNIKYKILNIK